MPTVGSAVLLQSINVRMIGHIVNHVNDLRGPIKEPTDDEAAWNHGVAIR